MNMNYSQQGIMFEITSYGGWHMRVFTFIMLFVSLNFFLFCRPASVSGTEKMVTPMQEADLKVIKELKEIKNWVGRNPQKSGFFETPVIIQSLKKILTKDYQSYLNHVSLSGCGSIQEYGGFICIDVSQLHVGGYSSVIVVDLANENMFLFWLDGTVHSKVFKIYGKQPIPRQALEIFSRIMNDSWGHVAHFKIEGDSLKIDLK